VQYLSAGGRTIKLSHHESHVLALIRKWQPTTAYFVRKALGQRLSSDASDSPGSAYPVIEKLKRAGLVSAQASNDGRKTELLRCTADGEAAVRNWFTRVDESDLLPEDPWRTRVLFVDQLAPGEAESWLHALREALDGQLERLDRMRAVPLELGPQLEVAHARHVTAARLAWANEAIALLARAPRTSSQG
jgi:DNA-binding PadR family transcriptional regulator